MPEPIHQRREVDGIAGGPPVVIVVRIDRRPHSIDGPVGIQGEGEEGGGSVASGVDLPDCAAFDGSARQIWGVLATSGGALDRLGWRIERGESAADSQGAQLGVQFSHRLGDLLAGVLVTEGFAFGVGGEQIRPSGHQRLVLLRGLGPLHGRFSVQVPALAALGHPQPPGLVRTWRALVVPGGPARNRHDVDPAGGGVDAAHGQRSDAHPVLFG